MARFLFVKLWVFLTVFLGLSCRVGEAKTPGPPVQSSDAAWSIWVCNPSGLLGKGPLLASLQSDIIAVSETHLTAVSKSMLLTSLKATSPYKYVVTGAALQPRTTTGHAGTYSGVAVVSQVPSRSLGSCWPLDMFETGRVQLVGSFVNHMWVTGGLLYGYPAGRLHVNALERTNAMLNHLVEHMTQVATGPGWLGGDWNFVESQLPITQFRRDQGWEEVQTVEFLRHGRPPEPTCKKRTQKDFLWLSPELLACYRGLRVDLCVLTSMLGENLPVGFCGRYLTLFPGRTLT